MSVWCVTHRGTRHYRTHPIDTPLAMYRAPSVWSPSATRPITQPRCCSRGSRSLARGDTPLGVSPGPEYAFRRTEQGTGNSPIPTRATARLAPATRAVRAGCERLARRQLLGLVAKGSRDASCQGSTPLGVLREYAGRRTLTSERERDSTPPPKPHDTSPTETLSIPFGIITHGSPRPHQ
jgi:hypothetical protein